jgi:hypothetical protein
VPAGFTKEGRNFQIIEGLRIFAQRGARSTGLGNAAGSGAEGVGGIAAPETASLAA